MPVINPTVDLNPYATQLAEIERRKRMAALLQQQGMEPLESQTVGGRVIPISPWQVLAKALQTGMGAYQAGKAGKAEAELQDRMAYDQRSQEAEESAAFKAIQGRMFGQRDEYTREGKPVVSGPTVSEAAPLSGGDQLQEITPTGQYKYDPQGALQMAMTPAGMQAMQKDTVMASMLANMAKPKEPEEFGTTPVKGEDGRYYLVSKSGRMIPTEINAPGESKAPTTVGGMQYDPATKSWMPIPGYTEQAARIAAAGRGPENPVAVTGPDGQPRYVTREQAMGQKPYTGTTIAQDLRAATQEQTRNNASLSTQQTLDTAAQLYTHPGREAGTGKSSFVSNIPGTAARDFKATLDTFKAQTFLPMVTALRGTGALSDKEGKTLTEAVGALDPGMSEEAFAASLKSVTKYLYDKAKASGLNVTLPSFAESGPSVGTIENGYKFKGGNPSDPKNWEKQ